MGFLQVAGLADEGAREPILEQEERESVVLGAGQPWVELWGHSYCLST